MSTEQAAAGANVSRRDLQLVIRRAAELYAAESDGAEILLTEEEVVRVGEELGLPTRLVRQALFELPDRRVDPSLLDRLLGATALACSRTVSGDAPAMLERLHDYLTAEELLQLRRRSGEAAWFSPADDTISNVTRALKRPKKRFHLARLPGVRVHVRALQPGETHVRMVLDAADRRRRALRGGVIGGVLAGGFVGSQAGAAAWMLTAGVAAPPLAVAAGLVTGAVGMGLGMVAVGAAARRSYRHWCHRVRTEAEGLLDRLERGEPLAPPPAPWRRKLQRRLQS